MKNLKKIKTALIGAGNMGKNHARVYSEISDFVAVADVIPEIGKPLAEKYKINFYTDYKEMLNKEQPDAVSVVVPTRFHKNVTMDCLQQKIPVLVEKPIAASIEEADDMVNKAREQETFLMVGHIERFNPAVVELKKIIDKGKLGKIISLLAVRVGIAPPRIPNSDVALDLAIHDIDAFNYLLNSFPKTKKIVRHKLFKNSMSDSASILLEYDGTSAIIQTNWITPIKMRKLYATGTDGFVELDYINQKITLYNKIINTKMDGDFYEFLSLSTNPKKEIFVSQKEPLKEELTYFLKNLNSSLNNELISSARVALETLESV